MSSAELLNKITNQVLMNDAKCEDHFEAGQLGHCRRDVPSTYLYLSTCQNTLITN